MKYSVITINYNNCAGLISTIESVVSQDYHDFEYIIIDGGSTDGGLDIIHQYSDRIDYWVSEPDGGIYNAMNKGILQSHGEYLIFMNSGDTFYQNNVLRSALPYLNKDILLGKCYNVTEKKTRYQHDHSDSMRYLYETAFSHQASFIRRSLFTSDSLYREDLRLLSDWEFFVRKLVFENCSFSTIPIMVCNYDGNGISANTDTTPERRKVLNEFLPPRIQADYEHFKGKDSSILRLTPLFNRTYRLEKFIYTTVRMILWFYYRLIKHSNINIPQ